MHIKLSVRMVNIAEKTKENRLRRVGRVKRRNYEK